MDVSGASAAGGPLPIRTTRPATNEAKPITSSKPVSPQDELEISSAARMMDSLNQGPDVRAERLGESKAAIDQGKDETPEKLEAALGRMLDELGLEWPSS